MPEPAQQGQYEGHYKHRCDDVEGELVHHLFNITLLVPHLLRIHHDSSLFASINDQANNPARVPQEGALEQHLFGLERIIFSTYAESTLERIDVTVGRLNLAETRTDEFVRLEFDAAGGHDPIEILRYFARFHSLLTIQRASLNVA